MSQNSSVQLPFYSSHYLKYDKSKNSAKYHKILISRFWEIVFRVTLLFSLPCLFVQFKTAPSCKLLLTARKTGFRHLKNYNFQRNSHINILPTQQTRNRSKSGNKKTKQAFTNFVVLVVAFLKKNLKVCHFLKEIILEIPRRLKLRKHRFQQQKSKTTGLKKNNGWKMTVLNHDLSTYFYFSGWGSFGSLIRVMKKIMG